MTSLEDIFLQITNAAQKEERSKINETMTKIKDLPGYEAARNEDLESLQNIPQAAEYRPPVFLE